MRKTNFAGHKFIAFLLLLSGVFHGCIQTEGTLKLKGKISDAGTNVGIQWKNIIIQGLVDGNDGPAPVGAGSFSTDSMGCFEYTMRKTKGAYNYNFCLAGNPDYPVTIIKRSLFDLKKDGKYLVFSMNKLVDLTIKINRECREALRDTLHLFWESDGVYGLSLYPYKINNYGGTETSCGLTAARDLWWEGGDVNSVVDTKVFAEKTSILTWELYRNGRRMEFTDTIVCKRDFANIVYFSY